MSVVTDVILCVSLSEEQGDDNFPAIDFINKWLRAAGYGELNHLNRHEGGFKAWQLDVFGGAFNYLDIEGFTERLLSAPWEQPECVRLIIKGEDDEVMEMVYLFASKYTLINKIAEQAQQIIERQVAPRLTDTEPSDVEQRILREESEILNEAEL